jgi:pyruvate dehydrogenase E2 component (dihydrolipoamide acetyltransferase)
MAQEVILPKQGQSVETCLILGWKKQVGDPVQEGETLVEVETDKAAFEIPAPASGTLLAIYHKAGEDVPVLSALALIGQPGEAAGERPAAPAAAAPAAAPAAAIPSAGPAPAPSAPAPAPSAAQAPSAGQVASADQAPRGRMSISPRARRLAHAAGLSQTELAGALPQGRGSGPGGRVLESDVRRLMESRPARPAAVAAAASAAGIGASGSAVGGAAVGPASRVPVGPAPAGAVPAGTAAYPGPVSELPLKGIRKIIAERMLVSTSGSAQYTLHAWANAEMLTAYRKRLKDSPEELGLRSITIGDLVNFAAVRVMGRHPEANSHLVDGKILQFQQVHLGFAVDTPRGLMVPVIRNAGLLSLKQLSAEAARLRQACLDGRAAPEELAGGTFTVTNLGSLGVEHFTPVLNPPQTAILGVGAIALRPVEARGDEQGPVVFKRHIALSLTANHQVLDGAPAARILSELCTAVENIGLMLAG